MSWAPSTWHTNVRVLATGGTLVVIGLQGGAKAELDLRALMAKRARVMGTTLRARPLEQKEEIVAAVKTARVAAIGRRARSTCRSTGVSPSQRPVGA